MSEIKTLENVKEAAKSAASPVVPVPQNAAPPPTKKGKLAQLWSMLKKSRSNSKVKYARRTRSKSKLSFRSLSNLIRNKREPNMLPYDFELWPKTDQQMYHETTQQFKLLKHERYQCSPLYEKASSFTMFMKRFRNPRTAEYRNELAQYYTTVQYLNANPIEHVDLDY
ncbi:unnamed protein product [Bursaphelenchus okinawaensis]|uniref:Uncharacterized protein n=1 Tax=Bursaphelenchus okinawaensis TaxID=465554 RepID=A0A811L231_9BILA|nr:unnamed protein product [Bursaphelenchus okinawaensis]CAG9114821.1 unnamed protein product [Bursaphelenchus okinawaensis]